MGFRGCARTGKTGKKMKVKIVKKAPAAKTVVKKSATCALKRCAAKKPAATAVTFTFHADAGKAVYVAGEFNGWDPAAKEMSFRNGVYAATVKLAPGDYQYKFVVDGAWCIDPENANSVENDQGTRNSIVTVR